MKIRGTRQLQHNKTQRHRVDRNRDLRMMFWMGDGVWGSSPMAGGCAPEFPRTHFPLGYEEASTSSGHSSGAAAGIVVPESVAGGMGIETLPLLMGEELGHASTWDNGEPMTATDVLQLQNMRVKRVIKNGSMENITHPDAPWMWRKSAHR